MAEYLLLFHNTPGVLQTRKAMQSAGIAFRVQDIPRQLKGGCGLCIRFHSEAEAVNRWVTPGVTEAIYRCDGEEFTRMGE
ncbi:DUF3343 domain-containing protein [Kosakonia pseudosacchari]|uniref:DUF3343 domain-containing protein n=1 Tax=Kosakonia pseudosacchari TaxID=1646340 RepID=UPI00187DEF8A|nr:DUF3343 domain-containing protein [Kosakonia pseudosacchari]QOV64659.1 DUF3343 domain-containing protein [Kosakonia pseudosacchari]WBU48780.1 DUF3343 domain-containing protein [Kosakonia pseudosacchari]